MIDQISILPAAVRSYTVEREAKKRPTREGKPKEWPRLALVLDTETTLDRSQRLTFGCYQVRYEGRPIEEGIIGADDLRTDQRAVLEAYAVSHRDERGRPLTLRRRADFVEKVFWPIVVKGRGGVVGFNLPFDLSRLSIAWKRARKQYAGGFSFVLSDYQDDKGKRKPNPHRPRLALKSLGEHRALIGLTSIWKADPSYENGDTADDQPKIRERGRFLDLHTLLRALRNESYSLARACEAMGTDHRKDEHIPTGEVTEGEIDYCRHDVRASWELSEKVLAEYRRHPLDLPPDQAYSTASVGKAYLQAMGVDLPPIVVASGVGLSVDDIQGLAMGTYYGGRAECHIRKNPVPVVYCDFLSMYPTVNALMGLWGYLTAQKFIVEDATAAVRSFLDAVTEDDLFCPDTWRRLPALVEVQPEADVLPFRTTYDPKGSTFQIGVNRISSARPHWYTLADVIASKLLNGKTPQIVRALRFRPEGRQPSLRPIELRGEIPIDPRQGDFFTKVIEERQRLKAKGEKGNEHFLKILANSTSYGIFVEINRQEDTTAAVEVYGLDHLSCTVAHVERPGRYFFPLLGTLITGAARLMLALAEAEVTRRGGHYAMMDTDSLAVVASEHGGLVPCVGGPVTFNGDEAIRALSWDEVKAIVDRFRSLNPYDPDAVPGSVLKVEDENFARDPITQKITKDRQEQLYALVISAKRYALYNRDENGQPILRKCSDHGLGHFLPPFRRRKNDPSRADWTKEVWEMLVRESLGLPATELDWLDQPVLTQLSISAPAMLDWFKGLNARKRYADQIKPHNFMLVAHVAPTGYPHGSDPNQFILVAPYGDPRNWRRFPWTNRYDGKRYPVEPINGERDPQSAGLSTFRSYLATFRHHPEAKSAGKGGVPCEKQTVGLLQRRQVKVGYVVHVGKEANKLEQVEAGIVSVEDEVYNVYSDPWDDVRFALERMPTQELSGQSGLSRKGLYKLRYGMSRPHPMNHASLRDVAVGWVRRQHHALGYADPDRLPCDVRTLLAMYRHESERDERRQMARAESRRAKRAQRRELYAAINVLGGIGRHRDGDLAEE